MSNRTAKGIRVVRGLSTVAINIFYLTTSGFTYEMCLIKSNDRLGGKLCKARKATKRNAQSIILDGFIFKRQEDVVFRISKLSARLIENRTLLAGFDRRVFRPFKIRIKIRECFDCMYTCKRNAKKFVWWGDCVRIRRIIEQTSDCENRSGNSMKNRRIDFVRLWFSRIDNLENY